MYSLLKLVVVFIFIYICPLELLLVSSIYFIFKFKKNIKILTILFFAISYNLPFFAFGYLDIYFSFFDELFTLSRFLEVLKIHTIFFVVLFWFIDKKISLPKFLHNKPKLYYFSVVILLLLILAPVENTILNSSSYDEVKTSRVFIPIEYGVGFFFFITTYLKKNKYFVNLLAVLFCLKYLSLGMRVAVVEVLLIFILTSNNNKFNLKKLLSLGFITIIVMNLFAILRSGRNEINWLFVLLDLNVANAGEVLYSSIRILGISDLGFLSFWDKLVSFFYLTFGFLFPGISASSLSNLSGYMRDQYPAGGGGLVSVYFFVMIGYLGVTLVPILIAKTFNKINLSNKKLTLYISILFFMFPRWYSYYPTQLFKFPLYFLIFYLLFQSKNSKNETIKTVS